MVAAWASDRGQVALLTDVPTFNRDSYTIGLVFANVLRTESELRRD